MEVVEHTELFGPNGRKAFSDAWWAATGWWIPNQASVMGYWLRHGYTRQAG